MASAAAPPPASGMRAYYMDSSDADQREPHELAPSQPVSREHLAKLGVLYWYLPGATETPDTSEELAQIRKDRGYTYVDFITVSADRLPNYEQKIKTFFEEHLHTDEEIRFILDGTGYFDVRDVDDRWIRIAMGRGDMIVLPKGMYHRFTLDTNNYLKAMRLFVGDPVWTPWNRADATTDAMKERAEYVADFVAVA